MSFSGKEGRVCRDDDIRSSVGGMNGSYDMFNVPAKKRLASGKLNDGWFHFAADIAIYPRRGAVLFNRPTQMAMTAFGVAGMSDFNGNGQRSLQEDVASRSKTQGESPARKFYDAVSS